MGGQPDTGPGLALADSVEIAKSDLRTEVDVPRLAAASQYDTRSNNFDFIRFMLATLVIWSHSFGLPTGENNDALTRAMGHQMTGGRLAVCFFFILSGFLVAKSWEQSRSASDFVRKRALRIYPGFFAAITFCVLIVAPLGSANFLSGLTRLQHYRLYEMLFLHPPVLLKGVFTGLAVPSINGALWTIPFELTCYIGLLLLGLGGAIRRKSMVLLLFAALYFANKVWPDWNMDLRFFGSIGELLPLSMYFLAGSIFYLYRRFIPHRRDLMALSLILVAVTHARGLNWTLPIGGAYAVFYIAFSRGFRLHRFGRFGDFSYGLYLYAYPIQQLLLLWLGRSLHPLWLFALAMMITLPLAAASWHGLERPFLRLKPRPATPLPTAATLAA
jgi:peptidoglycan/LPS O-acetylase OafA/YrhL